MIETYWNEMFGAFKQASGKFQIPGLPEPLMSAHFGVQNIIGPTNGEIALAMKLCVFEPFLKPGADQAHQYTLQVESLSEAIAKPEFWDYQQNFNHGILDFSRRLLPFLAHLNSQHFHFFVMDQGQMIASAVTGVSPSACFMFNASVRPDLRKHGIAKVMTAQIRATFPDRSSFYWTLHPWLGQAASIQDYYLLKPQQQ